ncbi:MAG: Hpt domain-containing protein [Gammaproteobacteria bacterium]|nr:Hpt domain-containing protein [Gammaproteobacteria bacterium]
MKKLSTHIIDWKHALKFMRNDINIVKQMIELLIRSINEEYKPNLTKFLKEKNYIELSKMAHKISGGSRYCGTMSLEKAARQLENSANEKDEKMVQKYSEQLMEEMNKIPLAYEEFKDAQ